MSRHDKSFMIMMIIVIMVLVVSSVSKCHSQKLEKQLKKLECRCVSEMTYIDNGEVRLTQWDKAITIQLRGKDKVYYFKDCNKERGLEFYEIDSPDMMGFLIIGERSITVDIFTMQGYKHKTYKFKEQGGLLREVIRVPLNKNGKANLKTNSL